MSAVQKTGLARLWELAMRERGLIILACALAFISVACSFLPFVAIFFIIRELVLSLAGNTPADTSFMIRMGWFAGGMAALSILLYLCALVCSHLGAFRTQYQVKRQYMVHLAELPLGYHTANPTGKLRKIVDENIEKLELFMAHQLPDLAGSLAIPISIFAIMFAIDWRFGLCALVPVFLAYLIIKAAYGREGAGHFMRLYQQKLEDMGNASVEYVRGISVIKAFNQTLFSFKRLHNSIDAYTNLCLRYTFMFENSMAFYLMLLGNAYLFLLPLIIFLAASGGDYLRFAMSSIFYIIFSVAISGPLQKLLYMSNFLLQVTDGMERMDEVLRAPTLPASEQPQITDKCDIEFDQVSFSYGDDNPEALHEISFRADPGTVTALVGPSGSGKSTLASLLPRFYDVGSGAIKIGGVDIRDMSSDFLMSQVSFVFQDIFLFKQSIMDNILVGRPSASREEAIAAAQAAQCEDFVMALPNGYDTVIGTANVHLSGGERQRLVIARAILKNAPILVLDEATAFADPQNEHKIYQALGELMKNRTVIMIAHRLSTVIDADQILVLDQGRLVERGKHQDLLQAGGTYARMWDYYTMSLDWKFENAAKAG